MAEPARSRGPIPAWLGRPLAPLYARVIAARNRGFDRGQGVRRLPIPVISVGNLSVGGTGKTPMVMHIVRALLRDGSPRPCIAMRGYKKSGHSAFVPPDEADSYRRMFPEVPLVVGPDRYAGVSALLARPGPAGAPTCIILDDGFQHRALARDLDIVLVDASRPPERDHLLPRGWLREPIDALARASLVALTHTEHVEPRALESTIAAVTRHHRRPPEAITRHLWTGLLSRSPDGASDRFHPLDALLGKRVFAACAIGNPDAFLRSLAITVAGPGASAAALAGTLVLPDHDPFNDRAVADLLGRARAARAQAIVVTDKDWSKLARIAPSRWPCPVYRPILDLAFDAGQPAFDERIIAAARGQS